MARPHTSAREAALGCRPHSDVRESTYARAGVVTNGFNRVPARERPPQGGVVVLVLTRKSNQSIMIGDEIEVSVLSIMGEKVRIGIQAPRDIPVFRKEVYLEIQSEAVAAGGSAKAEVDDALKRLSTSR